MKFKGITRKRIFEIIEKGEKGDKASILFDWIIISIITLSVLSIIAESFEGIPNSLKAILRIIEIISILIFSLEYLLRLLTADYKYPRIKNKILAVVRHGFSFMALIDLIVILPFYLPFIIHVDFRFLRILRLFRILRILKISRYNDSFTLIQKVFSARKYELIVTISTTFLLLLLSSSAMYFIENRIQPDKFPNIIASFWWAIATLTTVGYGDVYPLTALGKILSGIIALLGIGIVALPTGIISTGFMEVMEKKTDKIKYCPHCGKKL